MPDLEPVKDDAKIKYNLALKKYDPEYRPPQRVNLGCALLGFANPHPDITHPGTGARGVCKRFIREIPMADSCLRDRFSRFVKKWLKKNLKPLDKDTDLSFEKWISEVKYPDWRKNELRRKYEVIMNSKDERYFKLQCFFKQEVYPQYKHARAINSRTDEFKTLIGPWFRAIEKAVFALPWFIKKTPVDERPDYIMERIGRWAARYVATDYTAYESHFTRELMSACEFELYRYMTEYLPNRQLFWYYLEEVLAGRNVCEFKWFTVQCQATRMSGEMNTSLGNGFANLMIMLFVCKESGCSNVVGVVEGDDGLFVMTGTPPTAEDFKRLGLTIKLEVHTEIETASFCGIIFDKYERRNVTDPIDVLMDFGWTTGRYKNAGKRRCLELLKAKSLSLLYQYPGCPIISALARYGLRVTRGVGVRRVLDTMNLWEREQLLEALSRKAKLDVEVGPRTRMLVQEKFGILIEHQIEIEQYLDNLEGIQPLDIPLVGLYAHPHAKHFYENFWNMSEEVGGDIDRPRLAVLVPHKEPPLPVIKPRRGGYR